MPGDIAVTGRYLVLLCEDKPDEAIRQLADITGVRMTPAAGRRGRNGKSARLAPQCALVFDKIGVALVRCAPDGGQLLTQLAAARDGAILAVEPERAVHALAAPRRVGIPTPVPPRDPEPGLPPARPGTLAPEMPPGPPLSTGSPGGAESVDARLMAAYLQGYRDGVEDLSRRLSVPHAAAVDG